MGKIAPFLLLLVLFIFKTSCAQKEVNDSLFKELKKLESQSITYARDTQIINYLNALGYMYQFTNPDSGIIFAKKSNQIAAKNNYIKGLVSSLNTLGICYQQKNKYGDALESFLLSINYSKQINYERGLVEAYLNLGNVYSDQGNYNKAYDYYLSALKIDEKNNDTEGLAADYANIGIIFAKQADYEKGLNYFFKALGYAKKAGRRRIVRLSLSNIGLSYASLRNYEKAREYYAQSLKIAEDMNNKAGMASVLSNIGGTYNDEADSINYKSNKQKWIWNIEKAYEYYLKSLQLCAEIGNEYDLASNYGNLAMLYIKYPQLQTAPGENKKGLELAEYYLLKSIQTAKAMQSLELEKSMVDALIQLYNKRGDCQKEIEQLKRSQMLNDTLFNQDRKYELMQKEMGYEFDRKETIMKQEQKHKEVISQEEKKRREIVILIIAIAFIVLSFFAVFIFKSLITTKKQKNIIQTQKEEVEKQKEIAESRRLIAEEQREIISVQKHLVEDKQKEILDSINYAQRLQQAILPPKSLLENSFDEYFLMYKPKDIVAGDFYWLEKIEKDNNEIIFFAVADCTGHGVPGAMVSMVCHNALTRCVKEFEIYDPASILNKTREIVIETFSKSENDVKDGMDISLAVIIKEKNTSKRTLQWAGANNPLWILQQHEVIEITADKMPIGKYDDLNPFTTHELEINPGDQLLLFTDGYADQFGGPKLKKFKYKPLKEMFVESKDLSVDDKKILFIKTFENWKGNNEQIDDVCVLGVKFT